MKRSVLAILFVVVALAMLVGLNRKQTPGVQTPFYEAEDPAIQRPREVLPPAEAVESGEKRAVSTVHGSSNIGETHIYDRIVTQRRHDLSPRLISVITNQIKRVEPLAVETYDKEDWHDLALAKMDYVAGWATALHRFAEQNGGKFPGTLDQAADFYPDEYAWLLSVFDTGRFEIVYRGSLSDLRDAPNVILVREREPTVVLGLLQHWQKAYIYGNGESSMVAGLRSADEFQTYENQHMANGDGG